MDNVSYSDEAMLGAGLPYDNINWNEIAGQPFGTASRFNVIIFNDANNIVDVEGPVAIGGNFFSPRGLSVGYVRKGNEAVPYSPDLVRFLSGGNVSMTGPLVVRGHVVVNGGFRAAKGSTYLIGKSGMDNQIQELKFLYQNNRGSQYWTPSDKGDHYVVPSYDVPRYIPASRVNANLSEFFSDAREGIGYYKDCIEALEPNGSVVDNNHEWILRGNNPVQNVFILDTRPNGLINKGIRAEVPQGSTVIVRMRTGASAHLQYGVYGERSKTNQTLYVFEDATNIYMEKSTDIWGSILAPQAMFHAHSTGGHVSGNVALGSFAVNANSGFEFHFNPFVGGVRCQTIPAPIIPEPIIPEPVIPAPVIPEPIILEPVIPAPEPCPACPEPLPCPIPEPCPVQEPCPTCPEPEPCPTCPIPEPCPMCPTCPEPEPCPSCPSCPECPICPTCPEPEKIYIPVPMPVAVQADCPEEKSCPICPECQECRIEPGNIMGCVRGCCCGNFHNWDVKLFERCNDRDNLICCTQICGYGYFEFSVPFEGCYILKVRQSDNCCQTFRCKPSIILNNVGVECFMIE